MFIICRSEGGWRVMDGDAVLADCADHNLASAAAARLARAAFDSGTQVRIVTES